MNVNVSADLFYPTGERREPRALLDGFQTDKQLSLLGNSKIPHVQTENSRPSRAWRTLGIFAPSVCRKNSSLNENERELYEQLRALGFCETRWQFVYEGQKIGLVRPYANGVYEIHIRIYEDRIFAELEIGRGSPLHFLFPLLNANQWIRHALEKRLSSESFSFFESRIRHENLALEESKLALWEDGHVQHMGLFDEVHDQTRSSGHSAKLSGWMFKLHRILKWENLAVTFAVSVTTVVASLGGEIAWAVMPTIMAMLISIWAPRMGKP